MRFAEYQPRISARNVAASAAPAGERRAGRAAVFAGRALMLTYDNVAGSQNLRAWIVCPRCQRKCRYLYLDGWACRRCLRLRNISEHGAARAMPLISRIMRLRRKAGVDPRLFSVIVRHPCGRHRFQFLLRLIHQLEGELLGQMAGYIARAERRLARADPRSEPTCNLNCNSDSKTADDYDSTPSY